MNSKSCKLTSFSPSSHHSPSLSTPSLPSSPSLYPSPSLPPSPSFFPPLPSLLPRQDKEWMLSTKLVSEFGLQFWRAAFFFFSFSFFHFHNLDFLTNLVHAFSQVTVKCHLKYSLWYRLECFFVGVSLCLNFSRRLLRLSPFDGPSVRRSVNPSDFPSARVIRKAKDKAKVTDGWVGAAIHEILTATLIKYISKDGLEYY